MGFIRHFHGTLHSTVSISYPNKVCLSSLFTCYAGIGLKKEKPPVSGDTSGVSVTLISSDWPNSRCRRSYSRNTDTFSPTVRYLQIISTGKTLLAFREPFVFDHIRLLNYGKVSTSG